MRYRTKLTLGFIGIALFSAAVGQAIVYVRSERFFFDEYRSKARAIASAIATGIDAEMLKQIHGEGDEKTAAYMELQAYLRRMRNANRRSDVYLQHVTTVMPSETNPKQLVVGVDSEENPKNYTRPGHPLPPDDNAYVLAHFVAPCSPDYLLHDESGTWVQAMAPVTDSQGHYVATVTLTIEAKALAAEGRDLLWFGFNGLLACGAIAALLGIHISRRATDALHELCDCVHKIGQGDLNQKIDLKTNDEFNVLAGEINLMEKGLKERDRMRTGFARYVSQHVMENIVKSEAPPRVEGERRKVTILFSDVRRFTDISETLPPETVVSLLNEYFEKMIDVIFKNFGTLDKFLGDGIMVEFGAPLADGEQEKHAIMAAIEMQKEAKQLSEKWKKQGRPTFEIGIGIHTGQAVVGNIGSEKRLEYTAIGDAVNVAARLQQQSKSVNAEILVSEDTLRPVQGQFKATSVGSLALKGHKEQVTAYSILA